MLWTELVGFPKIYVSDSQNYHLFVYTEESQCTCVTQLDTVQDLVEQKLDVVLSLLNASMCV